MIQGVPYDAEIEYLESTGTQYIDTGIKPDDNTQCYVEFLITGNNTNYDCVAACESNGGGRYYWICARSGNYDRYVKGTTSSYDYRMNRSLNVKYTVLFNGPDRGLVVNGTKVATLRNMGGQVTNSLTLYAEKYSRVNYMAKARIYTFQMTDKSTGSIIRDFIPVRVGTEGFLYDRVTGKLFGNMGTGSFVLGQDTAVPVKSIRKYDNFYIPMPGKIMRGGGNG